MSRYKVSYDYIERAYGRRFKRGQRIRFDEDGREGIVVNARPSSEHYVNVAFDGENHKSLCHPMSVTVLAGTPILSTPAARDLSGTEGER